MYGKRSGSKLARNKFRCSVNTRNVRFTAYVQVPLNDGSSVNQRKLNGTWLRRGSVNQRKHSSHKRKFYGIIMLIKFRVLTELINLVPASLLPELFPFMYGLFFNSVGLLFIYD